MENNEYTPAQPDFDQPVPKVSPFEDSPYVMPDLASSPESEPQLQNTADEAPVFEFTAPEPLPKKKASGKKVWKAILAIVVAAALVVPPCFFTLYLYEQNAQYSEQFTALQQQIAALEEKVETNSFTGNGNSVSGTPDSTDGLTPGQVYAQNNRSVVAISNQSTTTNFYGQITSTASSGSGFIISSDGYIITNYHVVEDAETLTVITSDGAEHSAKLIGFDDGNDFALIKIDATDLPEVKLGSSEDLIIGDQVVAIGNPLGELTNSLSVGYVSAKERDVSTEGSIINMLQTDAAINPGNSGGPLFNMKGEVIGITTAKYSGTTSSGASIEGIGFAIPIDDVISMVDELMEKGYISTPYIGIRISQRTDGMGVYVESVDPGTPAEAAGMKAGDIIVGIGEYTVKSLSELDRALRNFEARQTTSIFVYRNRQVLELSITLAEKNQASTNTPS